MCWKISGCGRSNTGPRVSCHAAANEIAHANYRAIQSEPVERAYAGLSEAASLARWTLPLFGEHLRDSLCYRGCAREGDVRHYCHRQSAFGEREKGRHFFNPKMAIVARSLDLLTRQCHGLEIPA